jgi:hypothetical protein
MKKLYVHIGTHKTGTTSLQNKLSEESYALLKDGAFYISTTGIFNKISILESYDSDLVKCARKVLVSRLSHFNQINTFITSSEHLSGNAFNGYSNSSLMAKMLHDITLDLDLDVYIIVYIRRQDRFIESLYMHMIESGYNLTFNNFVSDIGSEWFNWKTLIESYENIFGKDRMIVRNYNDVVKNKGFFKDFCEIVNIPEISNIRLNTGSSCASINMQRIFNERLDANMSKIFTKLIRKYNRNQKLLNSINRYSFFTDGGRFLMNTYYDDNNYICQKYNIAPFDAVKNDTVLMCNSNNDMTVVMFITLYEMMKDNSWRYTEFINSKLYTYSIKIRKLLSYLSYKVGAMFTFFS